MTTSMKLTKVEQRWRWLADRLWHHSSGWTGLSDRVTKADRAIIERKIAAGQVERDAYGMIRLTDLGRAAISGGTNG